MNPLMEVASAIQLAVAPAFLLTAIGATLTVMTNRLARIIDRFRVLNEGRSKLSNDDLLELNMLRLRAKWTHWAIALTTLSALLTCIVIASIFIGTEIQFNFDQFITSMALVSWIQMTSASVASNHEAKPFFKAARIPLML